MVKTGQPGRLTVQLEAHLSSVRTASLWDLGLNMQPCLTASALLSMAASAASLLASATSSLPSSNTVLLDMVASGPQRLPTPSQMTHSPSHSMLQLSVVPATGSLSISCNGASLMQSCVAHTSTDGCCARAAPGGPAGDGPGALARIVSLLVDEVHVAKPTATLAEVTCHAQDESGYILPPAIFEMPVSLAALGAQPGMAQPTWLRSAAAMLLPAGSAATLFVASAASSSNRAWSKDAKSSLQQEVTVFGVGLAPSAAEASGNTAGAAAGPNVTNDPQACDQLVLADSALLQMDGQERKLYIQAQVCTLPAVHRPPISILSHCCT